MDNEDKLNEVENKPDFIDDVIIADGVEDTTKTDNNPLNTEPTNNQTLSQPEGTYYSENIKFDKKAQKEQLKSIKKQAMDAKRSTRKQKRGVGVITVIIIALACSILSSVIAVGTMAFLPTPDDSYLSTFINLFRDNDNQPSAPPPAQKITIENTTQSPVVAIFAKVTPSVVGIRVSNKTSGILGQQSGTGEGSGVIYKDSGYIITNYHVVELAVENGKQDPNSSIQVFLSTNPDESYPATIIGFDSTTDLAVIKIDTKNLLPIDIGNSDNIVVGEMSVAVGSPGGLDFMNSVSQGIISGLHRKITSDTGAIYELIQTDTAINPGNSGGALIDKEGKLIGINVIKIASTEYEGMGFAIPINTVKEIVDIIIVQGKVPRPTIGIYIDTNYTADFANEYGLPQGVRVSQLVMDGPADGAGILVKDIIYKLNGVETQTFDALKREINKNKPGDEITLSIYRSSTKKNYEIKLILGG